MTYKITYVSDSKFQNVLTKSIDENKEFLLLLESEEQAEMKWSQNQFFTNVLKGFEVHMTPNMLPKVIHPKNYTRGNKHVITLDI